MPHPRVHDFHTINWYRSKVNPKTIEKSVNTILPNNGVAFEVKIKDLKVIKHKKVQKFLENYCKPEDKFEKINIKPKYFFSNETFDKVMKLINIFLEFDEDCSSIIE